MQLEIAGDGTGEGEGAGDGLGEGAGDGLGEGAGAAEKFIPLIARFNE